MSIVQRSNQTYPGPQKLKYNFNFLMVMVIFLALFFFASTVYSVIRDNLSASSDVYKKFFYISFLDTKTSCSILVSLIGLILVRQHFVQGFKPRLIYETKKVHSHTFLEDLHDEKIWQVKVRNVGLGAAVFSNCKFRLFKEQTDNKEYKLNFRDVLNKLQLNGILIEKDFCLTNITNGFTLPSKEERIIFEVKISVADRIELMDVQFEFEGFLGGKYSKEVYLIPRNGIQKPSVLLLSN